MFSRSKKDTTVNREQLELFEQAKARIRQKKRLFQHFILFLVGSLFLIIANVFLGFGKDLLLFGTNWFVTAIVVWAFLFVIHFCRVWLLHTFMGAKWEEKETKRLIEKQRQRIAEIQDKVVHDFPLPVVPTETFKNSDSVSLPGDEDEQPPLL